MGGLLVVFGVVRMCSSGGIDYAQVWLVSGGWSRRVVSVIKDRCMWQGEGWELCGCVCEGLCGWVGMC